jgi:hypothetical protein
MKTNPTSLAGEDGIEFSEGIDSYDPRRGY